MYRELADEVAAAGFLVVVPDFLHGDPFVPNKYSGEAWMAAHPPDKGFVEAKPILEALKSKGVSAIGAAGFCWGGMMVSKLAASNDIQAAVLLHPGHISIEDITKIKVPTAILGAETDQYFPSELVKQYEEILSTKCKVDAFGKVFPGVTHGWTLRYNEEDPFAVKSAKEAHGDMLNWLKKYVK
ncbi:Dienelactone hydrolase [Dillenia turbinata]|uniref:Dienelactone hydrolase n=1 Tax=Dillenia turbinata TaxID=194707 RepID=A0AAN8Z9J6_9MAGN